MYTAKVSDAFTRQGGDHRMDENNQSEITGYGMMQSAPQGWIITGVYPHQYSVTLDHVHVYRGRSSGTIQGKVDADPRGFGTLMQMFKAENYVGQRLRLSAFLKTDDVQGWAGMWMRIDGKDEVPINFDNMDNRPISGTTEWRPYEVVLDIAPHAEGDCIWRAIKRSGSSLGGWISLGYC